MERNEGDQLALEMRTVESRDREDLPRPDPRWSVNKDYWPAIPFPSSTATPVF